MSSSPSVSTHGDQANNLTTSPTLVLPNHQTLTTTLTPTQLTHVFPTIQAYCLPSDGLIALLPADSMTYRGLEIALRYLELNIADPGTEINAKISELIEMYQVFAFLGGEVAEPATQALKAKIEGTMSGSLSVKDIKDIWALRHLSCTESFIDILARNLIVLSRDLKAKFEDASLPECMRDDRALKESVKLAVKVCKWIDTEEELISKMDDVAEKLDMEEEQRRREQYAKRRRTKKMSAVALFTVVLENIDEEAEPLEL